MKIFIKLEVYYSSKFHEYTTNNFYWLVAETLKWVEIISCIIMKFVWVATVDPKVIVNRAALLL